MTQKEIAERLGMSQMTVSYALRGSKKISDATRDRVLAVADEIGYRPHHAARSLRSGKTGLIAPLGLGMEDGSVHGSSTDESTIVHLAQHLDAHGMHLSARYAINSGDLFRLPPWQVDAAALVHAANDEDCAEVEAANIPYVSINGIAGPSGSALVPDDNGGMIQAMKHLFELGHTRIAFALPASCWLEHVSVAERQGAHIQAMNDAGCEVFPGSLETIDDQSEFIMNAVDDYGATAIISYHTNFAVQLLRTCQILGFSVPADISLVTFNDVYPAEELFPQLTCVALPVDEMGRAAAELLVQQIGTGKRITRTMPFDEQLIVRESTAQPRS